MLELATDADDEVEVNYKDMTIRYISAIGGGSGNVFKLTRQGIVDLPAKPQSSVGKATLNTPE